MKENIWDLKPFGGGRPVLVSMHGVDANESIERDPERYTRVAPEGTVEYDLEQKRVAKADAVAKLKREENEALSEVARKRREKVDEIQAKKREEARAAEEKRLEREKAETPPNHEGDLQQIHAEATQEELQIKADFATRRAELEKQHSVSMVPTEQADQPTPLHLKQDNLAPAAEVQAGTERVEPEASPLDARPLEPHHEQEGQS